VNFLHDGAQLIETFVREYGLIALFIIVYLESFGAPLPGESALLTASLLAVHGDLKIGDVFVVVWIAAVCGDSTGYAIGKFGGRPVLHKYGPRVGLTEERLAKLEDLFQRHGPLIVIGARFVVILRQFNGLVAGSVAMPWLHFVLANIFGAAIWVAAWCLGPYFFGDFFARHFSLFHI
jgi:membrane protein DedA with SNARE-associated domain